jgi:hypothetical protein
MDKKKKTRRCRACGATPEDIACAASLAGLYSDRVIAPSRFIDKRLWEEVSTSQDAEALLRLLKDSCKQFQRTLVYVSLDSAAKDGDFDHLRSFIKSLVAECGCSMLVFSQLPQSVGHYTPNGGGTITVTPGSGYGGGGGGGGVMVIHGGTITVGSSGNWSVTSGSHAKTGTKP